MPGADRPNTPEPATIDARDVGSRDLIVRRLRLTAIGGARTGTKWQTSGARTSIGSHPSTDVQIDDPTVLNDDLIVLNRTASRVVLRDSLFGDMLDVLNPFRYIPAP